MHHPHLKDFHVLVSRTCDYVTLCGKRNLANMIKLKILRWGDYCGLSGGPKVITRVLIKGRQKCQWKQGQSDAIAGGEPRYADGLFPRFFPRVSRKNATLSTLCF